MEQMYPEYLPGFQNVLEFGAGAPKSLQIPFQNLGLWRDYMINCKDVKRKIMYGSLFFKILYGFLGGYLRNDGFLFNL